MFRVRAATGEPVSDFQIRKEHPQVSFREASDLSDIGFPTGAEPAAPAALPGKQVARGPVALVDGVWTLTYVQEDIPPVPVPESVSMRQARLALLSSGLLTAVNDAIAAAPGAAGEAARIEWEYAAEVRRDSPLVLSMTPALGITSEQLDQLFIAAAQIK